MAPDSRIARALHKCSACVVPGWGSGRKMARVCFHATILPMKRRGGGVGPEKALGFPDFTTSQQSRWVRFILKRRHQMPIGKQPELLHTNSRYRKFQHSIPHFPPDGQSKWTFQMTSGQIGLTNSPLFSGSFAVHGHPGLYQVVRHPQSQWGHPCLNLLRDWY